MNSPTYRKYLDRFWASCRGQVNIRIKIIGIVLGLVFLLGLAVTWQVRQLLSQAMYAQLSEQAVAFTRDLAARAVDPILINDGSMPCINYCRTRGTITQMLFMPSLLTRRAMYWLTLSTAAFLKSWHPRTA